MSVKTLIKNLPANRTTYIEHECGKYSIITKEAAEESLVDAKLYNISIKVPVMLHNSLPLTLMVRTSNCSEVLLVPRGESLELSCFNLVSTVNLELNLDY